MLLLCLIIGVLIGIAIGAFFSKKQYIARNEALENNESLLSQIQLIIEQQNELLSKNMDLLIEYKVRILTASFDRAMSYNNVIITLGYASLYAGINFTKDNLGYNVFVLVNVLAAISVTLFVGFTIYTMMFNLKNVMAQIPVIQSKTIQEFWRRDSETQIMLASNTAIYFRIWNVVFVICCVTGLCAALLTIVFNIEGLF
ncbi:MAG: hypothetical protein FJX23_00720 [Alphaproteobacteria bacterium]|nr:hypothetical protein [Alphaproteobacteria bacterium]